MAQGKLKVKAKVPEGAKNKNKQKKGAAVTKRPNCPMKPKNKRFQEAHKLKQLITKSVNKAVEDEIRARATSNVKLSKAQQAVAASSSAVSTSS